MIILVIDDHTIALEGLKHFLAVTSGVVVTDDAADVHTAARVLATTASGAKDTVSFSEQLLEVIRMAAKDGKQITLNAASPLSNRRTGTGEGRPAALLSERESQVMHLIAQGLTVGDIAERLTLSKKTISTYRTRILQKMGLHSTAEIVRFAVHNGLVD